MESRHEAYEFDNVYDASMWLEHVVEEYIDNEDWVIVEARVVWMNRKWNAGFTAVKSQGDLFG